MKDTNVKKMIFFVSPTRLVCVYYQGVWQTAMNGNEFDNFIFSVQTNLEIQD